jgi:hypothetical protein
VKSYFYEEALNKKFDLFGDFRLKERKKLHVWIWSSVTIFILLVVSISLISAALYAWHGKVKKECVQLEKGVTVLQDSVRATADRSTDRVRGTLLAFLKKIPDAIPSNTWLESIKCEAGICSLQGNAFDSIGVRNFSNKCGGRIKNCSKKGDFFEFALEVAGIC